MSNWDFMFDGQLEVAGQLDDTQLERIPARRGVVLLAAGDRPIQLITASRIRQRVRTRLDAPGDERLRKSADLRQITTRVLWKLSAGAFETDLDHLELARAIWPESYPARMTWKPPWFIHVDPDSRRPQFRRARKFPSGAVRSFGPFISGADAERFITALRDTFDLCRDHRNLAQGPNARRCSYGQMQRCLAPCDGTVSLDDYRLAVSHAVGFVAGDRGKLRRKLQDEMTLAAGQLEFERAAALKGRLERLGEFDRSAYRFARPFEEFRFLVFQPGGGRRRMRVFLVNRGEIPAAASLQYPLQTAQTDGAGGKYCGMELANLLEQMRRLAASEPPVDQAGALRMGLVTRYLFSGPRRRGLIVRFRESLGSDALAEMIESAAGDLRLSRPAKRRGDAAAASRKPKTKA